MQEFIVQFADQIRQQTSQFKYNGNLTKDAQKLGLKSQQLMASLRLPFTINSMARDIFKKMIPEDERLSENWNDLPKHVFVKEQILLGKESIEPMSEIEIDVHFRYSSSIFWTTSSR